LEASLVSPKGRVLPPNTLEAFHRRGLDNGTLAELTGLSERTLRRIEAGQPTTAQTRASLARILAQWTPPRLEDNDTAGRLIAAMGRLTAALNRHAKALEDSDK
jgi:DNA-binding XRE family transcriptional regulator